MGAPTAGKGGMTLDSGLSASGQLMPLYSHPCLLNEPTFPHF